MAWPATDFTSRPFADVAGDLAALCLAVNEREAALAITETEFTIADGTTEARPTATELSGFVLGDNGDTSKFRATIIEVQDAAESLVEDNGREKFTTTSGGSTLWSHADLIIDIGITDNTGSADFSTTFDWWDSNVWERLRQYLDALIYCMIGPIKTDSDVQERTVSWAGDAETTWDDLKADTPSTESPAALIDWQINVSNPAFIRDDLNMEHDTNQYSGSPIGDAETNWALSSGATLKSDWTATLAGSSKTIETTDINRLEQIDVAFTLASGIDFSASIFTSEPADDPFDGTLGSGLVSAGIFPYTTPTGFTNSGIKFWLDISGELTDQD